MFMLSRSIVRKWDKRGNMNPNVVIRVEGSVTEIFDMIQKSLPDVLMRNMSFLPEHSSDVAVLNKVGRSLKIRLEGRDSLLQPASSSLCDRFSHQPHVS